MSKPRKARASKALKQAGPPATEVPAGYSLVHEAPATDTPDDVKLEISRLKSLSRVIERGLETVSCTDLMGDLTAGEVGDLAGLLHARLAALDAAVWNT